MPMNLQLETNLLQSGLNKLFTSQGSQQRIGLGDMMVEVACATGRSVMSLGAVGSDSNANGGVISGNALTLQLFSDTYPGLVGASGGGTSNFLRADGVWAVPGGGGGGGMPGGSSGSIQWNNSGAFGGFGNYNGSLLTIPVTIATSEIETLSGDLTLNPDSGNINLANNSLTEVWSIYSSENSYTINNDGSGFMSDNAFNWDNAGNVNVNNLATSSNVDFSNTNVGLYWNDGNYIVDAGGSNIEMFAQSIFEIGTSAGSALLILGNDSYDSLLTLDPLNSNVTVAGTFGVSANIQDTSSVNSINTNFRHLDSSTGATVVEWGSGFVAIDLATSNIIIDTTQLYNVLALNDPTGVTSIDWGNRQMFDGSGVQSVSYTNRNLIDTSGHSVVNWTNGFKAIDPTTLSTVIDTTIPFNVLALNDVNGVMSEDWSSRILVDNSGNRLLDWSNGLMVYDAGTGNEIIECNINYLGILLLNDTNGVQSIDWGLRTMSDSSDQQSIDWSNRRLLNSASSETVDWQGQTLHDSIYTNQDALNWYFRTLVSNAGSFIVSWANGFKATEPTGLHPVIDTTVGFGSLHLNDTNGINSIDWGVRTITSQNNTEIATWENSFIVYDWLTGSPIINTSDLGSSLYLADWNGANSMDWGSRYLYQSSGTKVADWSQNVLYDANGVEALCWGNGPSERSLSDEAGLAVMYWEYGVSIYGTEGEPSIDATARILQNTSGQTVLDYSSTLKVEGGLQVGLTETATSYTTTIKDTIVGVDNTSAARTITLISNATAGKGFLITIKDESGGAATHNITVAAGGSDTIDGAATKVISTNYGSLRLYGNGAGAWFTI